VRACQKQAGLDKVWFTPAAVQPLKQSGPQAADEDRLAMLRLAIEGQPNWRICTLEIDRGGVSYTIDTLRQIQAERPRDELFLLLGSDAVADVPHWRAPTDIFRLARPLVVRRAGEPEPDLVALGKLCPASSPPVEIEMPPLDISSREIRRRAAAGEAIDDLVPRAVADLVSARLLYR
jgi:nicotinate-nucleotide adenylyltransferase